MSARFGGWVAALVMRRTVEGAKDVVYILINRSEVFRPNPEVLIKFALFEMKQTNTTNVSSLSSAGEVANFTIFTSSSLLLRN